MRSSLLLLLAALAVGGCDDASSSGDCLSCGGSDASSGETSGAGAATGSTASSSATGATGPGSTGSGSTGSGAVEGTPRLGEHSLTFYEYAFYGPPNDSILSSAPLVTQPRGSTLLVSVGRGYVYAHEPPVDSFGNTPYVQLGETHTYTNWADSGTALYAFVGANGGPGHEVMATTPPEDEITMAVVEVIGGSAIVDVSWREVLAPEALTAAPVTTTARATLVAFWWGDGGVANDKTAVPDGGFEVIDSVLQEGELVQCAVATKEVAEPGTYTVTWATSPVQGAQLWLVAVQ